MLGLKQRMVRVVLMLSSVIATAFTPKVAVRPFAVAKGQPRLIRRRK